MTKKEFAQFTMAMQTYFPKEQLFPNEEAMKLWYQEIKDIPLQILTLALRKWVNISKWSPSICELRSKITTIHWEAYEIISNTTALESLSEEERKFYQWVYEQTKEYKHNRNIEPTITQLLQNSEDRKAIPTTEGARRLNAGY